MVVLEFLREPLPHRCLVGDVHCLLIFAAAVTALEVDEVAVAAEQNGNYGVGGVAEHEEAVAGKVEDTACALVGEEDGAGDEGSEDFEGGLFDAAWLAEGGFDD